MVVRFEGEAEHKIINLIREQISKGQLNSNKKHYVISNDNDVIFLLLQFVDVDFSVKKTVSMKIQKLSIITLSVFQKFVISS